MLRQQRVAHAELSRDLQAVTQLLLTNSVGSNDSIPSSPPTAWQAQCSSLVSQLDTIVHALAEQRHDMKDGFALQQDALHLTLQVLLPLSLILVFALLLLSTLHRTPCLRA